MSNNTKFNWSNLITGLITHTITAGLGFVLATVGFLALAGKMPVVHTNIGDLVCLDREKSKELLDNR